MNSAHDQDPGSGQQSTRPPQQPPPQYPYAPRPVPIPPPRRRLSALTIILIIACGFLLLIVFGMAASRSASIAFGGNRSGKLQEKVIIKGEGDDPGKIVVVSIDGVIDGMGSHISGEGMVLKVAKQLRQAAEDDKVRAVLLQMDSPGGGLTASDIIRNEILRLQSEGKKVVVCVGNLAASGGLYISSPADYIIANPTALVGSIGVIMTRFQMDDLLRKLGIKYDPIKSTDMKDIGSPFRDLTQEERKYFTDLIDEFNDRFISIVSEGRNIDIAKVRKLANGKIYTAEQALEYKLIDEIGYFDKALEKATELAGLEEPYVIKYKQKLDQFDILRLLLEDRASISVDNLRNILESMGSIDSAPRIMAIWNGKVEPM